jgi:hypothetical protein
MLRISDRLRTGLMAMAARGLQALLIASFAVAADACVGSGLEGALYDAQGQPLPGAWIEARQVTSGAVDADTFTGPPTRSGRSGPGGRWSISGLDAGNWLVTVVASTTQRTDSEMQTLAVPPAGGLLPDGVAVTRLLRHVDGASRFETEIVDLGLAVGSSTHKPVAGHLGGAFDPRHFGYQITVSPNRQSHTQPGAKPGQFTASVSSADPNYNFTTVPAADGSFDFGPLRVGDYDVLVVETFRLDGTQRERCQVFFTQFLKLDRSSRLEIELPAAATVDLCVDRGKAAQPIAASPFSNVGQTTYLYWRDGRGPARWNTNEDRIRIFLADGLYLVQACTDELASPFTAVRIAGGVAPPAVTLALQPCPAFDVHLVDKHGAPLGSYFLTLGTEASADFPKPCCITCFCDAGTVALKHVPAGTYTVEFQTGRDSYVRRTLELKPGAPPITVDVP